MSDEAPVQSFAFRFANPVQDSGDPLSNILFIEDTPTERDLLTVEATPLERTTIDLLTPSSTTVSPTNHHFSLTFTLGTLASPGSIRLSTDLASQWVMVHQVQQAARAAKTARAKPTSRNAARAIGDNVLYFLYKGTATKRLDAENALSLMLHTIGAAPTGGSRSTVVRFAWRDDPRLVRVETNRLPPVTNLVEYTGVTVIRRRLAANPPLAVGFVSSDTILNDGAGQSFLQLRIVNTSAVPIKLSPKTNDAPTRITLRFYGGSTATDRAVLATTAQINGFKIPGTTSHGADTGWSTSSKFDVEHSANTTFWTLTPQSTKTALAAGEAILLPMSNVVTGHATGRSAMIIVYEGLPDYDDGELAVFIQKSPLVFSGDKVGIGTVAPGDKLTIQTTGTAAEPKTYGLTQLSGTVKLSTYVHSHKTTPSVGSGAVGTQSNHEFYIFANGSDKKHVVVKGNGLVGIGTDAPGDKLTIATATSAYGVTQINGALKLSSYLYASAAGVGTQSGHDFHLFTAGQANKRVSVKSTGNVGIGTDAPGDKLTISTGTSSYGVTHISGTLKLSSYLYASAAGVGTQSSSDFHLFTGGQANKRVSVKSTGNVGIGTEVPAEKLHVVGGNLRIDGVIKGHGPMDFYPNVDKTPNEDLLHVRNSNGTPVVSIKHDGALYFSRKPMEYYWFRASGDNQKLNTGYLHSEWVAILAGFNMACHSNIKGLRCLPGQVNGYTNWHVACDTIGGSDNYVEFAVLFIRREFVNYRGGWNLTSTRSEEGGELEAYDEPGAEASVARSATPARRTSKSKQKPKPKPRRSIPRRKRTPAGA